MESGPQHQEKGETPFYSTYDAPPVTDEEVLPLYVIYRRVSHGQTIEPYETMLKQRSIAEDGMGSDSSQGRV